jgi:hypothetical protein
MNPRHLYQSLIISAAICAVAPSISQAQDGSSPSALPSQRANPRPDPRIDPRLDPRLDPRFDPKPELNRDAKVKSEKAKKTTPGEPFTGCLNCATILSIVESRKKAKPLWMTTSDPNDPSNQNEKSNNVDKTKPENKFEDNSTKPGKKQFTMGGTLSNPETGIVLQRRQGFEVNLLMDDGSKKQLLLNLRPAYNIGAKVKVIGNSLMPF